MAQIPPGFCEIQALYTATVGTHVCQNSVGFEVATPLVQGDVDDVSDILAVAYKAQLNGGDTWLGVRVLEGQDGPPLVWESSSSTGAGARSASLAGPQVQGLLKKVTALSGRKFRGRMFIPDMTESQVGDIGAIDGTGQALLQAIADAWQSLTGTPAALGEMVLLHTDSTAPTPFAFMQVQTKVATLRKRYKR